MIGIAPAVMLVLDTPPAHSAAWGNIWERISASEALMLALLTAIGGQSCAGSPGVADYSRGYPRSQSRRDATRT